MIKGLVMIDLFWLYEEARGSGCSHEEANNHVIEYLKESGYFWVAW